MRGHHRARRLGRATTIFLVIVGLLVAGIAGTAFAAYRYDQARADRILPGITIDGDAWQDPNRPGLVVAVGGERRAGDSGHQEADDDQEDRRRPPQPPGPVVASHLPQIPSSPACLPSPRGHQDTFPFSQSIGLGWRDVKTLPSRRMVPSG